MTNDRLADALMRAWLKRGWLPRLLWPLSALYGVLLACRRFLYRVGCLEQRRLPVPVIVVGNIFVGGTGKTPLVIWLLEQLTQAGYRPGVISRGYGRTDAGTIVVTEVSLATEVGDEPLLIARQSHCPVAVGRNRHDAGVALLKACPEIDLLVTDDGLQHLALHRDIEVVLFDSRGVGNGWLLPAGPLREPAGRSRDFTVLNLNAGDVPKAPLAGVTYRMQLSGSGAWQLANAGQRRAIQSFAGVNKLVAAAGIGNPGRFFAMLRQQGLQAETLALPDHFDYAVNPFSHIDADIILITEKDAVKCRQSIEIAADPRIWVVTAEVNVAGGLAAAVLEKLEQRRASRESPIT